MPKIPIKLQHISVPKGPSSGSTSSFAKVTTMNFLYRFSIILRYQIS